MPRRPKRCVPSDAATRRDLPKSKTQYDRSRETRSMHRRLPLFDLRRSSDPYLKPSLFERDRFEFFFDILFKSRRRLYSAQREVHLRLTNNSPEPSPILSAARLHVILTFQLNRACLETPPNGAVLSRRSHRIFVLVANLG